MTCDSRCCYVERVGSTRYVERVGETLYTEQVGATRYVERGGCAPESLTLPDGVFAYASGDLIFTSSEIVFTTGA